MLERIWETVQAGRKHLYWRIDTVAVSAAKKCLL